MQDKELMQSLEELQRSLDSHVAELEKVRTSKEELEAAASENNRALVTMRRERDEALIHVQVQQ